MNKNYLIIGLVAVVAAFSLGYYFMMPASPAPQVTPEGDLVIEELGEYYAVHATYPKGAPEQVEQALRDIIAQFKQDSGVEELSAEDAQIQGLSADRKYTLDIAYEAYTTSKFRSYVFTIYQDTLGAHPNGFYRTLSFDAAGEPLELGDLFVSDARYLDRLSSLAYQGVVAELTERTGVAPTEDMLETVRIGTAPSPEALQFFYVTEDAVHLLFPPYQVAAYAAGAFDITIPLQELENILK